MHYLTQIPHGSIATARLESIGIVVKKFDLVTLSALLKAKIVVVARELQVQLSFEGIRYIFSDWMSPVFVGLQLFFFTNDENNVVNFMLVVASPSTR